MPRKKYIVAYCDILGTREMIKNGKFGYEYILDFANALVASAFQRPNIHVAIFSDNAFIITEVKYINEFIAVIKEAKEQWLSDFIFVRGGIDVGDVHLIDFDLPSRSNIIVDRFYGGAICGAVECEKNSGPGALFYLTDTAVATMTQNKVKVVNLSKAVLNCTVPGKENQLLNTFTGLKNSNSDLPMKHIDACLEYCNAIIK
jgi:hypothetical protein